MKNERNPIPIDSKKHRRTTSKAAAKHTATRREKPPEKARKAGPSKTSTKNKAAERNKTPDRTKRKVKSRKAEPEAHSDSMPARLAENKHPDLHQHSYAAHLDGGPQEPHTKPAGMLRYGAFPMARKQP